MPAVISTHARERGHYTVSITFYDEDNALVTPTNLLWTLTDMDGNVINNRDAVTVTPSESTENDILGSADTVIVAGQINERLFLAEWIYNSTYGTGITSKKQAIIVIDDILHLS